MPSPAGAGGELVFVSTFTAGRAVRGLLLRSPSGSIPAFRSARLVLSGVSSHELLATLELGASNVNDAIGGTRRERYDRGVLDRDVLTNLALSAIAVTDKAGSRAAFVESSGRSVLVGERCWLLELRSYHRTEKLTGGPGWEEATHDQIHYYVDSNGIISRIYTGSDSAYTGQYREEVHGGGEVPASDQTLVDLDFEPYYFSRREGRISWESNVQPSKKLRSFVRNKGDGIREHLIGLAREDARPALRRQFPSVISESKIEPTHCGTLVRFISSKGFGFISPDGGDGEIFLHQNQVDPGEVHGLAPGARMTFNVRQGSKGLSAYNVRVVG